MGKIKQLARNIYFFILNTYESLLYIACKSFFGSNIAVRAVAIVIAVIAVLLLAKVILTAFVSVTVKVATSMVLFAAKTIMSVFPALIKSVLNVAGSFFLFVCLPLAFLGLTKPFKVKYHGKKRSKSAKRKEE